MVAALLRHLTPEMPPPGPRVFQLRAVAAVECDRSELARGQELDLVPIRTPADGWYLAKVEKSPYDREKAATALWYG